VMESMMPGAQRHQIGCIGGPAVLPMPNMVHVEPLGALAPRF
jgi:hypothetical protein